MSRKQEIIAVVADVVEDLELISEFLPDSNHPSVYAGRLRDAAQEMLDAAQKLEEYVAAQQELQAAAKGVRG